MQLVKLKPVELTNEQETALKKWSWFLSANIFITDKKGSKVKVIVQPIMRDKTKKGWLDKDGNLTLTK